MLWLLLRILAHRREGRWWQERVLVFLLGGVFLAPWILGIAWRQYGAFRVRCHAYNLGLSDHHPFGEATGICSCDNDPRHLLEHTPTCRITSEIKPMFRLVTWELVVVPGRLDLIGPWD